MTIIVRDFSKLVEPDCGCLNWMDHWEKATGGRRVSCAHVHCCNEDIIAIPVYDKYGQSIIVPLCMTCAAIEGEIEIAEAFVAAIKLPSCKLSSFK